MDWARLLAYTTGTVDQELLLRAEAYLPMAISDKDPMSMEPNRDQSMDPRTHDRDRRRASTAPREQCQIRRYAPQEGANKHEQDRYPDGTGSD